MKTKLQNTKTNSELFYKKKRKPVKEKPMSLEEHMVQKYIDNLCKSCVQSK